MSTATVARVTPAQERAVQERCRHCGLSVMQWRRGTSEGDKVHKRHARTCAPNHVCEGDR